MGKAERTRQFIIEQSAPVFNVKGLAATAMSDVMGITKMAKGGLYGHFESKEDLSRAVVDYNISLLISKVSQVVAGAETAREKLFAMLDLFSTPVQFPVEGGCPLLNFGAESDDTNPEIKKKVRETILGAQKRIANIILDGIEKGEFKPNFDSKTFAIKTMTIIEGGTLIGRVLGSNSQMKLMMDMLKKEIEEELI
ncbi:TetR/AcrR family transcriptional regulator [Dyadobacter luticola]|uniref:TetR/AcrR family transcriptional regulator n=1 Tax=Dyadobacter luticola TaxID=1979387 RepID=A0A5R9L6S6_9BACT|nr:TetR/AcrR family transcriptional regulator [Dyadobacter luticola]TLV03945.1 TetR/AcrR family transcriptional regulator [Dyadobacter luticola]